MRSRKMRKRREVLYEAQQGICVYCREPMPHPSEDVPQIRRATVDHIIPRSLGGSDAWDNLIAAHGYCNFKRGSDPMWRQTKKRAAEIHLLLVAQTQN